MPSNVRQSAMRLRAWLSDDTGRGKWLFLAGWLLLSIAGVVRWLGFNDLVGLIVAAGFSAIAVTTIASFSLASFASVVLYSGAVGVMGFGLTGEAGLVVSMILVVAPPAVIVLWNPTTGKLAGLLAFGGIVGFVLVMFPPWVAYTELPTARNEFYAGRSFYSSPPEIVGDCGDGVLRTLFYRPRCTQVLPTLSVKGIAVPVVMYRTSIDMRRLLVELLLLCFFLATSFALARYRAAVADHRTSAS